MMAGFGITAVAVAPLANDATPLAQHLVVEAVVPEGLDAQLEALSALDLPLTRSDITRSIDTPEDPAQPPGRAHFRSPPCSCCATIASRVQS